MTQNAENIYATFRFSRGARQLRNVDTLTPIISATSLCEARSFSRTALMSARLNVVIHHEDVAIEGQLAKLVCVEHYVLEVLACELNA